MHVIYSNSCSFGAAGSANYVIPSFSLGNIPENLCFVFFAIFLIELPTLLKENDVAVSFIVVGIISSW